MYANPVNFEHELLRISIITGTITGIIGSILSLYTGRKAIKNFQKENPEEEIRFIFEPIFMLRFPLFFFYGGFIGYCLLPIFLYENVGRIDMVTRDNLIIYNIWIIIGINPIFLVHFQRMLSTNKLFVSATVFKLQKVYHNIAYTEMANITYKKVLFFKFVIIEPIKKDVTLFGSHKKLKKGYEILKNEWLKNRS